MKINLFIIFSLLFNQHSLFADNLIGEEGNNTIKITNIGTEKNKRYYFEYCEKTKESKFDCQPISKKSFTPDQLDQISKSETTEAILKTIGTAGAAVVLFAVGLFTAPIAASAVGLLGTPFAFGISYTGLLASSPFWLKKLNPFRQFKQANVLKREDFIKHDVVVNDEDVSKVADLLADILN
jgi:hypothetical protein